MKYFLMILVIFTSCTGKSQKMEEILDSFKKKNVAPVINQCAFPFNLSAASKYDDQEIIESSVLKDKLQKLFNDNFFDETFKGKPQIDSVNNQVTYEVKSFNADGELEGESTTTFSFKKTKTGGFKLYKIATAG